LTKKYSLSSSGTAHLVVGPSPAGECRSRVEGRILKRHGKLVRLDLQAIAREAAAANVALRKRAGWW
jgi:hypothetical protein